MFIAGSDTTAAVIRVTMLHIMSSPQVYQKLKEEIRSAIKEGKVSTPITNAEAKTLPYLQVSHKLLDPRNDPSLYRVETDFGLIGMVLTCFFFWRC
jgi:hypothetical protein